MSSSSLVLVFLVLVVLKWTTQIWLERLNLKYVAVHAGAVPDVFKGIVDEPTYKKSVEYTLAKGRLDYISLTYHAAVLLIVILSGLLPWGFKFFSQWLGVSAWATASCLLATGIALSLPDLPLEWYGQFRLEQRFGFNTTTQKLWWLDHLKGLLLSIVL